MGQLLALNAVLFLVPISGSVAFALLVYRFVVRSDEPPRGDSGDGGTKVPLPSAGPDDLARSA